MLSVRPSAIRLAQANGGAGLWDHQVGDGLSSVLSARIEEGHQAVESGLSGLECQAHGRATSENDLKGEIALANRGKHLNFAESTYFFRRCCNLLDSGRAEPDRLLGHSDVSTTMIYTHVLKVAAGERLHHWTAFHQPNDCFRLILGLTAICHQQPLASSPQVSHTAPPAQPPHTAGPTAARPSRRSVCQ